MTQPVTITILIENKAVDEHLVAEHGLSVCLKGSDWQTVFDTGQSGAFVENAVKLGIDLSQTTELALSHGHYDHTGGLPAFFDTVPNATVYAHPDATLERYSIKDPAAPKLVGIPAESLQRLQQNGFTAVEGPTQVNETLWLTGKVSRETGYEDVGGPFYLDAKGTQPDPITDDQALWFLADKGLVVILGCAHAGIINTIQLCRKQSGIQHIHALIGGFHLVNADEHRLTHTIRKLKDVAPDTLAACHCTGTAAVERMKAVFPDTFFECGAGSVFTFSLKQVPHPLPVGT